VDQRRQRRDERFHGSRRGANRDRLDWEARSGQEPPPTGQDRRLRYGGGNVAWSLNERASRQSIAHASGRNLRRDDRKLTVLVLTEPTFDSSHEVLRIGAHCVRLTVVGTRIAFRACTKTSGKKWAETWA
jgi:hypothetical protein